MGNEASLEGGDVVGMAGAPGSVSAPPGSGQLHKPVNGAAAGAPLSSVRVNERLSAMRSINAIRLEGLLDSHAAALVFGVTVRVIGVSCIVFSQVNAYLKAAVFHPSPCTT
ncbi:hypothetical protein AOLI_G00071630 [Acnodon oligacanthus]